MAIAAGTRLGRYEIRSQIGAGGMGEVYLAQDLMLDRAVALKVLPADVASNQQRMHRFVQEAKAAAKLSHPNSAHVYEIGESNDISFIAMEYIDGVTLRQYMANARIKLSEALDIAIQVASALAEAHEAGIVHRDIKPENIMLLRRGLVKVLDFGLAKLTEKSSIQLASDSDASTMIGTSPGVVMGTATYMSPEQARGLAVDARTDLWSLSVVLYEMVAGRIPFAGETMSDMVSLILLKEPPALTQFSDEATERLDDIVMKGLAKDREERYQAVKDLLIDLKRLKQKLDIEAEIERIQPLELRTATGKAEPSGRHKGAPTAQTSATRTTGVEGAYTTSSVEYLVTEIKRHKLSVAVAALAIVITGTAYFFARSSKEIDSIAVLPLINASADPDTEYLSDGITETLINSLTRFPDLRVVARSTAFRYKGKEVDPQQVGRDLNVRTVLTGRVLQRGDTLTIQAELVDVANNSQLWGEQYNRKLADLLVVQQEISREITEKLRLRISGEEQKQLIRHNTSDMEAYQLYLKGRYYWNKRTAEGLKKAIEQFQQAIDKDPNYALAHVGLADSYLVSEEYIGTPASETIPKAKAAAQRALQIDDLLSEAHASLAVINRNLWQWGEAENGFKRAIELNPNYPTTHHWYSTYLHTVGRLEEAMREIKRAQELDPLSPIIGVNVAVVYRLQGDLDSAIEEAKKVIELDPNFPLAHDNLGLSFLKQRRYPEAIAEFQKAVELSGRASLYFGSLGHSYALLGNHSEALAILKELEGKYSRRQAAGTHIAMVYAGFRKNDEAFAWLEKDFESHASELRKITTSPAFDFLRSDVRYIDLLQRMGLKPWPT